MKREGEEGRKERREEKTIRGKSLKLTAPDLKPQQSKKVGR